METLEPRQLLSGDPRQMEYLDRGVVALPISPGQTYVGWRLLGTDDPATTAFDVYRKVGSGSAVLVNTGGPISSSTNLVDVDAQSFVTSSYFVRPVINGVPQPSMDSAPFVVPPSAGAVPYLTVPIQAPVGGQTPDGVNYTYAANDASVGDLDGDGQYEILLKWDPSNAKDNSQSGHTGNVFIDAYKLNGTRLWRIDLGQNIRAGAHYTQFMVYDFDGDGRAEIAAKTAPGTKDGVGNFVLRSGDDPYADYRNAGGYILAGPEYLTVFDGLTGAALDTEAYNVPRHPSTENPTGTQLNSVWGDNYGNRVDRFLGGVAYLDGVHPSLIMARGYYTRSTITAWDFQNGQLTQRWLFDSNVSGSQYRGQGNHNLSIADVDADGKDEIVYGAMAVDDNGAPLYTTGWGHGDALHVSDFDPTDPGLEVWDIHEPGYPNVGASFRDAGTGTAIFTLPQSTTSTEGPGRGVAADIWAGNPGPEMWVAGGGVPGGIYSTTGANVGKQPSSVNFLVWWDADPTRELLDSNSIRKYSPTVTDPTLLTATGSSSNNGTKSTPALSADILGDWREEVIWRTSDNTQLRIYSTTIVANTRMPTLMHDSQYRVAVAWQNTAYNQPPHPSFFLGATDAAGTFPTIPTPNIYTVQNQGLPPSPPANLTATVGGLNQINLSWSPVANAVSYTLMRAIGPSGALLTIASDLTETSFTNNGVANGTTYFYVVTATDAQGRQSVHSTQASARVPLPGNGATSYPAEDAAFGLGAFFEGTSSGYLGEGYVNFPTSGTTGYLQWNNIYGGLGVATTISIRYASTADWTGTLVVNGVSLDDPAGGTFGITFNSTGSLTTWQTRLVNVNLNSGTNNTIRLQVNGTDLPNIDNLSVTHIGESVAPTITDASHSFTSLPNVLSFTFDEGVNPSIGKSDLVVTLLGPNTTVAVTDFQYNTNTRVATFTLPVLMADGNYRASFVAGGVIDAFGNAVSPSYGFDFFVLGGDANHDRKVDLQDLVALANNWMGLGKNYAQGDFNGDGLVDATDLGILATRWQQQLAVPPEPSPAVPTSARRTAVRTPTRVISQLDASPASVL